MNRQEYHRKWAKEHKEERRLYRQQWYQENKARLTIRDREKRRVDPEYRKKRYGYTRKWIEKNKEWWLEYQRKYHRKKYATDPVYREKLLARSRAYYYRKRDA